MTESLTEHLNNKLESEDLKPLRHSPNAWQYAKEQEGEKKSFIFDFSYIWGSLIQNGYDSHRQNYDEVIEQSLAKAEQWIKEVESDLKIDKDFVSKCLNVILKFWTEQRGCICLQRWFHAKYA